MFSHLSAKKKFLTWLVTHESFAQREVIWILNYLINHEAILENVHFVEQVEQTDRGILIVTIAKGIKALPMTLFVQELAFTDTDQIFHDIRMNWEQPLYLECRFLHAWENEAYLSVLEDNPFVQWYANANEEMRAKVRQYFSHEEQQMRRHCLYRQINAALDDANESAFFTLASELAHLKNEK